MSVALPRNLVAPIPIHGDDRLKSSSVKILAANANSTYSPSSGNRIVFNIPSFSSKVFINPQRSYLSFNIKKTGPAADSRLVDGIGWIERMTLKMGATMVEDIQNYALLERIESLYESNDNAEGRATLTGDYSDVLRKHHDGSTTPKSQTILDKAIAQQASGRNYVKPLLSGVIGKGQQFYVPVGMLGGSSQSIQMELFLAPNNQVVTRNTSVTASPGYELSEVALFLECVELPERALKIFNSAVLGGGTVKLPYKTTRCFQQHIPSGQTHIDFNIVENSKDCEKVMVAMRQQSKVSGYTTADVNGATDDCFALRGGENSGGTTLSKYQFRYGTEQFPPAPVEVRDNAGTTPAILHGLSSCDMLNRSTRLTSIDIDGNPVFENHGFFIAQGFKTSDDNIENGLNTAVGGAPIELKLDLSQNNTDISMFAFVRSNYSVNIGTNGSVRMTEGSQ
jgi:hypothetical protein